jgi:hypothetical protein
MVCRQPEQSPAPRSNTDEPRLILERELMLWSRTESNFVSAYHRVFDSNQSELLSVDLTGLISTPDFSMQRRVIKAHDLNR